MIGICLPLAVCQPLVSYNTSMFVTKMTIEFWVDRQPVCRTIHNPNIEAVRQAVSNLENGDSGGVALSERADGDACMLIGNAGAGLRIVNTTVNNHDFFSLIDASRSSERVLLYLGGQDGDFPDHTRVPLAWALKAAEHYAMTGQKAPDLPWVSDY